jgi:uncharacterized protein
MKSFALFFVFICAAAAALAADSEVAALEKQAGAGDAAAQNNLGARYQSGDGVPKDLQKALALYQKAATGEHAVAAYNLAFMHDMGIETTKDRKLANQWYQKSAEQGYAPAMLNLGMNLASGEGAPQNFIEGMKWVDLARFFTQREKDMQVKYRIRGAYDALKARLTKSQLAEAEKRSKAWYEDYRAKHPNG